MITLSYILRKFTGGYKLHKSQQKINHLMYMDGIKIKKELLALKQVVRVYSEDIWMEYGIEKCTKLIMKSGKRQMAERIELPN